jgi:hypothetical protein
VYYTDTAFAAFVAFAASAAYATAVYVFQNNSLHVQKI